MRFSPFTRGARAAVVVAVVCGVAACSAPPGGSDSNADAGLDALNGDGGGTNDGAADGSVPRATVWSGYVELYSFASGSDNLLITFDPASGDGPRTGTVVFGMGSAPPPATDPTVGYPPGFHPGRAQHPPLIEGFAYPIVNGSVTGARVQLQVDVSAPWAGWCALQAPIPQNDPPTVWGCLPNTGTMSGAMGCAVGDPSGSGWIEVDCVRMYLCAPGGMCDCDASHCFDGRNGVVTFDFHVSGNNGDGAVQLDVLHNIHLTD